MEYNYFSSYGDYGSPTTLIPKKTVEDITANAPKEMDTFKEVADKINEIDGGSSGSSEQINELSQKVDDNKAAADAKFEEVDAALATKADASDLENLATKEELEQVKTDVQTIIQDAPESLDTLKEIADLLETKQDASEVVDALASKVDTSDFESHVSANDEAFAAINETVANKVDSETLESYATTEYVDNKVAEVAVPTNVSEFTNDANYTTLSAVAEEGYTKFDGDYNSLENKPTIPEVPTNVSAFNNDAEYTTMAEVEAMGYSTFDGNYSSLVGAPTIPTVPTDVSEFNNDAGYLTTTTADERYYDKATTDSIFVSKSQYEDDLDDYTTNSELADTVHELVVRLNKLEAQNAVLVEKGTDSADDITGMSDEEAANADIVVATDEAIEALSTPKTFNSISIAGGEVGDNTVINLLAKDSIDVNGLTVSGTKGVGNGKIVYGSNDITISNVNIEPGCTVYNVFEGKQDKTEDNLVENFTATNVIVDDTDLAHNVFNIYQVNDGANILVKDSTFNLNVANSNVMRVSNITNAENVTITFENVDWNYENKAYTPADVVWAGLLIYQPYGTDVAHSGDYTKVQTWTVNVKNCRYNGELITENFVGTIKQAVYQYDVNGSGAAEDLSVFGTVNFE